MRTRHIAPLGLLLVSIGCQSYFPNSAYAPYGAYATPPVGTYAPPTTYPGARPTYSAPSGGVPQGMTLPPGRVGALPSGTSPAATSPGNSGLVPNPRDPGSPPASLGKPDDGADDFKNSTSMRTPAGARIDSIADDSEENLAALGDEAFSQPMPLRSVSANSDIDGPTRQTARPVPSPYLHDREGHTWLRGIVQYDEFGQSWRIVYSRDTADSDAYGGSLTMTEHPNLDKLRDNEAVIVHGTVDPRRPDRFGKPTYRVRTIQAIKPIIMPEDE